MAGSGHDVRERLRRAALELFRQNGYVRTTAAEIAAHAGVTERTFFRHFPDKREVLFDGEAVLRTALTAAIAQAPEELGPLDTLIEAFRVVTPLLQDNRPYAKPRQDLISATPALAEREMAKLAALSGALASALRARGVAALPAELAARSGMAAFEHAVVSWLDEPEPDLGERMKATFRALRSILTGPAAPHAENASDQRRPPRRQRQHRAR